MSQTPNIGCYKASHWAHTAGIMLESLIKAIQNEGIVTPIEPAFLKEAKKFLKIVLGQNTGDSRVDHQSARLHAISMAWRWTPNTRESTEKTLMECVQRFLSLLEKLSSSKNTKLDPDEQMTARQLIFFYDELIRDAAEDYCSSDEDDE